MSSSEMKYELLTCVQTEITENILDQTFNVDTWISK